MAVDGFDALRPPADPRTGWSLAPLGALPQEERLDEQVVRVLAPNPSPMTLDGTNTYVIGTAGTGEAAVVDPGPPDPEHLARVRGLLDAMDAQCRWVLVTHHHLDHAEAAGTLARQTGARVAAASRPVAGVDGRVLTDGETLSVGDTAVEVVATPGHSGDHVGFRLATGALLIGDHVLGRGTSVVMPPEGDLLAYLASLRRTLDLGADALYPGHGPAMVEDPDAVVRYYLAHREYRERQILAVLRHGPLPVGRLVQTIYHDVDPALWPYAAQSTRAALVKLAAEGVASLRADDVAGLLDAPDERSGKVGPRPLIG